MSLSRYLLLLLFLLLLLLFSGKCRHRTTKGYCCVPFRYRGRFYNGCARTRRGRRWCAITPGYPRIKLWGWCRGGTRRKTSFLFLCLTIDSWYLRFENSWGSFLTEKKFYRYEIIKTVSLGTMMIQNGVTRDGSAFSSCRTPEYTKDHVAKTQRRV